MGGSFNRKAAAIRSQNVVATLRAAFRIYSIFDYATREK